MSHFELKSYDMVPDIIIDYSISCPLPGVMKLVVSFAKGYAITFSCSDWIIAGIAVGLIIE